MNSQSLYVGLCVLSWLFTTSRSNFVVEVIQAFAHVALFVTFGY